MNHSQTSKSVVNTTQGKGISSTPKVKNQQDLDLLLSEEIIIDPTIVSSTILSKKAVEAKLLFENYRKKH